MTGIAASIVSFLVLGFLLGMRHATDADHVVAIATIVSREHGMAGSVLIGAAWGVGHTITVMAVGGGNNRVGGGLSPPPRPSVGFPLRLLLGLLWGFPPARVGPPGRGAPRASGGPPRACARPSQD